MTETRYTTVIVTRNRPAALALSLPLHLGADRLPDAVLVIDSSDDLAPNRTLIERLRPGTLVPLQHVPAPPGMTVQRNIGLAMVGTEVVFFPDDDSLMLPGAIEAMLRIYDRDADRLIGGVCAAASPVPPPGVLDRGDLPYRMTRADRLRARLAQPRRRFEDRFFRDPFHLVAERLQARLPAPPSWLAEENAIVVPWMTGFRMSFRTEVIRRSGFCETLGRYALLEDIDAGFGVLRSHHLIGARNARIYHHKAPERRANGRALGAMQLLNHAYVIARSGETDAAMRAALRRFEAGKILQYALGARGRFGRDRLAGAWAAARVGMQLLHAPPDRVEALYLDLRARCFGSED
ncbi:MAG: glycosyltransferase family 2 protein [Gemmobacter sp.]